MWTSCSNESTESVIDRVVAGASDVALFSVLRYVPRPSVQRRLGVGPEDGWVPGVQVLRKLSAPSSVAAAVDVLLASGPRDERDRLEWVPPSDLASAVSQAGPEEAVGLGSLCETAGGDVRHLPLIDFACPLGTEHEAFVRAGLVRLGQRRGLLADSGNSYHYYGLEPIGEADWRAFMAEALLLAPYVDARYVAHRLLGGVGVLRLGEAYGKPVRPRPLAVLSDLS